MTNATIAPTMCPLCHAVAPGVTEATLAGGGGWHCTTCGQRWDAGRLATVAAYAAYVASRSPAVVP